MNLGLIIIITILALLILYTIFKPYNIKYDTTLLFCGGLGTGKTVNAVKKTGIKVFKGRLWRTKFRNKLRKLINKVIKHHNFKKHHIKKKWKVWHKLQLEELPLLISNIPIRYSKKKNLWSIMLEKDMLTLEIEEKTGQKYLKKYVPEGSVLILDEISQIVNQFNWNIDKVQHNFNEFIQLFRHYVGGNIIMTAQADSEVVKQIRCKMNQYYELFNFQKFFFGLFYRTQIVQYSASEMVQNVNMQFVEDNMKWTYGCLKPRIYDSRCYSERYKQLKPENKILEDNYYKRFDKFKTNNIIRFEDYKSPLDTKEI